MRGTPKWLSKFDETIRAAIDRGYRDDEIAMMLGRIVAPWDQRTFRDYIEEVRRKYLGSGRRPGGPSAAEVIATYKRLGSKRAVARTLGCSDSTVRRRLKGASK